MDPEDIERGRPNIESRWTLIALGAWIAILVLVTGAAALYGGRHCNVPKSGPFHWILKNQKFVPTHSRSFRGLACRRVQ